jgi:hypothetical protein
MSQHILTQHAKVHFGYFFNFWYLKIFPGSTIFYSQLDDSDGKIFASKVM